MTRHPLPSPWTHQGKRPDQVAASEAAAAWCLSVGAVLLALALLTACGKTPPTAPPARPDGPCWVFKPLPLSGGGTVTLRAHYAVCPTDSALKALGWKREP